MRVLAAYEKNLCKKHSSESLRDSYLEPREESKVSVQVSQKSISASNIPLSVRTSIRILFSVASGPVRVT